MTGVDGAGLAGRRSLATGAAGFIGSRVADACLQLGMDVVAVDDLSGGFLENVPTQATWVEGDLKDPAFVSSLWDEGRFDYAAMNPYETHKTRSPWNLVRLTGRAQSVPGPAASEVREGRNGIGSVR